MEYRCASEMEPVQFFLTGIGRVGQAGPVLLIFRSFDPLREAIFFIIDVSGQSIIMITYIDRF